MRLPLAMHVTKAVKAAVASLSKFRLHRWAGFVRQVSEVGRLREIVVLRYCREVWCCKHWKRLTMAKNSAKSERHWRSQRAFSRHLGWRSLGACSRWAKLTNFLRLRSLWGKLAEHLLGAACASIASRNAFVRAAAEGMPADGAEDGVNAATTRTSHCGMGAKGGACASCALSSWYSVERLGALRL